MVEWGVEGPRLFGLWDVYLGSLNSRYEREGRKRKGRFVVLYKWLVWWGGIYVYVCSVSLCLTSDDK